jgi:hypothetical protein
MSRRARKTVNHGVHSRDLAKYNFESGFLPHFTDYCFFGMFAKLNASAGKRPEASRLHLAG